jgi:5-deoxy-D-glucuronate isomerase
VALVNVIPDLGGSFEYLIRAGPRARIGMARGRGSATGSTGPAVAWLCVEGGNGEIAAGTLRVDVEGREDVFEAPGWSFLIGPKTPFAIRGNIRYTVAGRSWATASPPRAMPPSDVIETRGHDGRRIRTYAAAGPLVCGETVHQPGGWASWPPHTHEPEAAFLTRCSDPDGFGVQILDTKDGGRRAEIVADGEVHRIRSGRHPVVSSPAGTMVTVWVLAGVDQRPAAAPEPRPG